MPHTVLLGSKLSQSVMVKLHMPASGILFMWWFAPKSLQLGTGSWTAPGSCLLLGFSTLAHHRFQRWISLFINIKCQVWKGDSCAEFRHCFIYSQQREKWVKYQSVLPVATYLHLFCKAQTWRLPREILLLHPEWGAAPGTGSRRQEMLRQQI